MADGRTKTVDRNDGWAFAFGVIAPGRSREIGILHPPTSPLPLPPAARFQSPLGFRWGLIGPIGSCGALIGDWIGGLMLMLGGRSASGHTHVSHLYGGAHLG